MSESVMAKGTGHRSGELTGSAEDLVFIGCAHLAAGGCSGYQVSSSEVAFLQAQEFRSRTFLLTGVAFTHNPDAPLLLRWVLSHLLPHTAECLEPTAREVS